MPRIPDRLRELARRWPDETAYEVVGGDAMTFDGWRRSANRLARGLAEAGVQPQDRVLLVFEPPDALRQIRAYWAVQAVGAITVAFGTWRPPAQVTRVLDHAEPAAVLASATAGPTVEAALDDARHRPRLVVAGPWDDLRSDDGRDLDVPVGEDAVADILYTSGTTGDPKGVVTRHANAMPAGLDELPDEFAAAAWLHASPLDTIAGQTFTFTPASLGMTGLYLPDFEPERWLDVVEDREVAAAFLVPSMVERLLAVPDVEERDLSSLTMVTVGSAPIDGPTLLRLRDVVAPAHVTPSYSLTELGTGYTAMPEDRLEDKAASVGGPMPPLEVRIADPDSGRDLGPDRSGEILARVPGHQREYWRDPERTDEAWDDEGWLRTGDLGHLDADGFLYVEARLDDVIVRDGHNVVPRPIEDAIAADQRVRACAVVGAPDDVLGERVVAFVVPVDGARVDPDELRERARDELGDREAPDQVEVVDDLPRNEMGKVRRDDLVPGRR